MFGMWRRMEQGIRLLLLLFEDTCVTCNHSRDQSEEYLSERNSIIMQSLHLLEPHQRRKFL